VICQKSAKIDAAYVTADTSFDATNMELPMAPLDSALKTGLDTVLWRHDIIVSTRDAAIFQRGAMSGRVEVLRHFRLKDLMALSLKCLVPDVTHSFLRWIAKSFCDTHVTSL
jgi:hypothetical protein